MQSTALTGEVMKLVYEDTRADLPHIRQFLAEHGYPTGDRPLTDEEVA